MLTTLAFRHLTVRKVRSMVLLLGFVFGVAAMIVLLSVGQAMLDQSRDVALVGGGEVTVLPQGIDIEALRTGAAGAQFFGVDRARFMTREVLGGPRQAAVAAVAPVIERKLVYVEHDGRLVTVQAGGEIPSRSRAVGAGLHLIDGRWDDAPADSVYIAPTAQQLYDELDRFHRPGTTDSTWAEWQYFNIVLAPNEWVYLTYFVRGDVLAGRGRGIILVTHRRLDGRYDRYTADVPPERVSISTSNADVAIGESRVQQRNGRYHLQTRARGDAGTLAFDLELRPRPKQYFPPVEVRDREVISGYVVPAVAADVSGTLCFSGHCRSIANAPAYHDHNWGIWRDATWEWGSARGATYNLVYGGVYNADEIVSPFFLTLLDSLGVRQALRFNRIDYRDFKPAPTAPAAMVPTRFELLARNQADTVRLAVQVQHQNVTPGGQGSRRHYFVQMRGAFTLTGRIAGRMVADSGSGFFETYVPMDGQAVEVRQ